MQAVGVNCSLCVQAVGVNCSLCVQAVGVNCHLCVQAVGLNCSLCVQAILVAALHGDCAAGQRAGHHTGLTGRIPRQLRPGLLLPPGAGLRRQSAGLRLPRLRLLQHTQGRPHLP